MIEYTIKKSDNEKFNEFAAWITVTQDGKKHIAKEMRPLFVPLNEGDICEPSFSIRPGEGKRLAVETETLADGTIKIKLVPVDL